jgi:hypothetical protein
MRPLQNLRHPRPHPETQLGCPRRRRWTELSEYVAKRGTYRQFTRPKQDLLLPLLQDPALGPDSTNLSCTRRKHPPL